MTTKLRVHFDGRVLVPEEPVDLPIGESVEIRVGLATRESVVCRARRRRCWRRRFPSRTSPGTMSPTWSRPWRTRNCRPVMGSISTAMRRDLSAGYQCLQRSDAGEPNRPSPAFVRQRDQTVSSRASLYAVKSFMGFCVCLQESARTYLRPKPRHSLHQFHGKPPRNRRPLITSKAAQQTLGWPVDENDLRIAASALVIGCTVVSRDADLDRVHGLVLVRLEVFDPLTSPRLPSPGVLSLAA